MSKKVGDFDLIWNKDEIKYLCENTQLSVKALAEFLDRSEDSVSRAKVRYKVNSLQFIILENRKWKKIEELPNYEVSDHGEVRNSKRLNVLKSRIDKNGYPNIAFKVDGKTLNRTVHRLVAMAFIPNPKNKPHVNHKSGIKVNNHKSNLEWMTESENMQHAHDNRLIVMPAGEEHWTRKHKVKHFIGNK